MENTIVHKTIDDVIGDWPEKTKEAASKLLNHYGDPDDYSSTQIIWRNTRDGWKRTILSKDEIPHNFPHHHTDFLEQSINYNVPVGMYTPLAEFDGSVFAERTKGELSSRSANIAMNFAAINLAHDIIIGEKTVKEAREEYTYLYKSFQDGKRLPYAEDFQFDLPANTGDPDSSTI